MHKFLFLGSFQGRVIAVDKNTSKVEKTLRNISAFDLSNVKIFKYDSSKICTDKSKRRLQKNSLHHKNYKSILGEKDEKFEPPYPPETFDKILLDAPCSALGQRPLLNCHANIKSLKSHAIYQRKLIPQVSSFLIKY